MADQSAKKPSTNLPFPNPFDIMRDTVGRMMDMFFEPLSRGTPVQIQWRPSGFQPCIDIIEEDDDIRVVAEVPGMTADDLSISVSEDSIMIRGQKKREDEEGKDIHRRERSHGSFRRVISLPTKVDREGAEAIFKNGVLTIILPKSSETGKKISIRTDD